MLGSKCNLKSCVIRPLDSNVMHGELENVPLHIGDPRRTYPIDMVAPRGEGCLKKIIGVLSSVPPLASWRDCVPIQVSPLLIRTLSEVDSWKTVHPSATVTYER